jgi:hypothetical protein
VDKISKRVVSNKGSFLTCYLNPASLLNLTPEIVDRLFNAYQTDLRRKIDIVDGFEDFTCLIVLKDLSFVGHYTGIVSKIQTMVYKSCLLHVVVSSSLWLIIYKSLPDFPTLKPIHNVYFPSQVCLIGIEQSINYFTIVCILLTMPV